MNSTSNSLRGSLIGLLSLFLIISQPVAAQINLSYYLPAGIVYDSTVIQPREVILHEVGEWHVSHDKLAQYMQRLAETSPRVQLMQYGSTFEGRPLLLLAISSPQNLARLEEIKAEHAKLSNPAQSQSLDINTMPGIVWMGYSVHGNEPSGSNASMVVAYHLAAATGEDIDKLLNENVIIIDPSINPDGLNRFASWVNSNRSFVTRGDENDRELNEAWPRGRTNHYWFDLNRDWLPVQLPESKGRIELFQQWKPNILTDHHEMGSDASFFFQPGIIERNHPLIPMSTYKMHEAIATYHAKAFDAAGSFYYSQEGFDDFYFGKGSTYPDIQGSIGILFEQASSRGHVHETDNGRLIFPFTIRNHVLASFSTLAAAQALRPQLLSLQRDFYLDAAREAKAAGDQAWVFGGSDDEARSYHLAEILNRHNIEVYQLANSTSQGGKSYSPQNSYVVPLNQAQHRLINAIFEQRTSFNDSLFYDISAWTLPLAFNLPFHKVSSGKSLQGSPFSMEKSAPSGSVTARSELAYLIPYQDYYAPRAIQQLLSLGIRVKVAQRSLRSPDGKDYAPGTLLVPVPNQPYSSAELFGILSRLAAENALNIQAQTTGFTPAGIDLGSSDFEVLRLPRALMLVGDDISGYDAGEIWHLFDQRYAIPLTKMPIEDFGRIDLSDYNTLILVQGSYGALSSESVSKIKDWVRQGGVIVGMKGASQWLSSQGLSKAAFKSLKHDLSGWRSYTDYEADQGAQVIGGAIFKAQVDPGHPIGYGYEGKDMYLFRNGRQIFETPDNGYKYPVKYTRDPLAAGYISEENLEALRDSPAVIVSSMGQGRVICFSDNPNFRAFWYGTNKLFINAVLFGHTINGGTGR